MEGTEDIDKRTYISIDALEKKKLMNYLKKPEILPEAFVVVKQQRRSKTMQKQLQQLLQTVNLIDKPYVTLEGDQSVWHKQMECCW
jgi:hypothetical protein